MQERSSQSFLKIVELALLCGFVPYAFNSLNVLSKPTAYALGVFIGSSAAYWLPPFWRFGFVRWIVASAAGGAFIYLYVRLVG